tara:strand:- start:28 stop:348 length:321 start_codon:yes stop_codon:yes gene_type:complete
MKFIDKLIDIKYATQNQKQKELWNVEGILKDRLNQKFKFDLRPLKNNAKTGSFKTKANKIVFDIKDQFIIVDTEELHQYIKENDLKEVHLQSLISKLDWNIILPKI